MMRSTMRIWWVALVEGWPGLVLFLLVMVIAFAMEGK